MTIAAVLFTLQILTQDRIASDFEIQQMEQQIVRSHDFISQLSGRLNLGDLRATRNENVLARAEYVKAAAIASNERVAARKASDLTRYATATSYAGLAQAKLANSAEAFSLAEEAMRYASDSAKSWNLYASTMTILRRPAKAASAARNAVAIEERGGSPLDLAIYRYALASSLIELGQAAEAEHLLVDVVNALRSSAFAEMQRGVQQHEAFEIYSSARGDEAAYISILNRAQLRLGRLYEDRGDSASARDQYRSVLAARSDEPTALGAMARLAPNEEERARFFEQAFDANPFSLPLIREYQRYLGDRRPATGDRSSTGSRMRLAIEQMERGDLTSARATLDALSQAFPQNDTIALLQREIAQQRSPSVVLTPDPTAANLRAIIAAFQDGNLSAEQRAQLDRMTFTSAATFNEGPQAPAANQTVFESGAIDGVPFRFSEPIAFQGSFSANTALRLTYRILGATRSGESDALLLEPLRLEPHR